jgi:hypothetical protein
MTQLQHLRWAGEAERRRAIERGLRFVYQTACDPKNFADYGFDYLSIFSTVFSTSKDHYLRSMALEMGRERARFWRSRNPKLPTKIDADILTQFVFAADATDRIGPPDKVMKSQIRRAAKHFSVQEYFWFDPTIEGPPGDIPETCDCGIDNVRGSTICRTCRNPLAMMSRYEVWLVALIRSYLGERYGVILGARYIQVLQWLPSMRPFSTPQTGSQDDFLWATYAVTHIVYTLNGYGVYKLSPSWLPHEFEFLKKYISEIIDMDDAETMGEILDSLKSFGLTSRHPLIRKGEEFVLALQNSDGSWGDVEADDIYERYHPTVAAIDGLRCNAWRGLGVTFENVRPLLKKWVDSA